MACCSHTRHNELLFALLGTERFLRTHQLRENWLDAQPGARFLDNPANEALLAPWRHWLLAHIDSHPAMSALTLGAGGTEPRWYMPGIRQYLQQVRAFLRRLLLLIHMTSGLPVHGRKLVRVHCSNTKLLRNLFICEGYIMLLLCEYGQQRVRFLPAVVGDLLLKFLVLVQPLARILHRQLPTDYAPAYPVHAGLQSSSRGPDGDCHDDDHSSNTSADTDVSNGAEWVDNDDGDDNDNNDNGDDDNNGNNDNDNNNGDDGNRHDIDCANELHDSYLFYDDGCVPWPPSQLSWAMR